MNGKDKPLLRIKSLNKDPSEILGAELALPMDAACKSMEAGQHSGSAIINYKEKYLKFYHEFNERSYIMSEVGRPETEVKASKKPKVGLRNISSCLFKKPLLPTPDFGLPSLTTKDSIKITVEPYLINKFLS